MQNLNNYNQNQWSRAISSIFPSTIPEYKEWTNIHDIVEVLNTLTSIEDSNHLFLPRSGGIDIDGVSLSNEPDCIELSHFNSRLILKPRKLIFVYVDNDLDWSYFFIEADKLQPTHLYENRKNNFEELGNEEYLRLEDGRIFERYHYDEGFIYDEEGNQTDLPENYNLIIRYFGGNFVFFARTSHYHKFPHSYSGLQTKFASEFKDMIKGFKNIQDSNPKE